MAIRYISSSSARPTGALQKIAAGIGTIGLGAVALMFSAVLLAALAIVLIIGGSYLWWRTRAMRKQLQAQMQQMRDSMPDNLHRGNAISRGEIYKGEIIEGQAVRVGESNAPINR
jgi:uncharacterized iron-regulated membrane protein